MSVPAYKKILEFCLPCFLRKAAKSPYCRLFMAFVLLLSGIFEATETVMEDFLHIEIRIHHGLLAFAAFQILIALEHILEGMEVVDKMEKDEGVRGA